MAWGRRIHTSIAMEYVKHRNLQNFIQKSNTTDRESNAQSIATQLLRGLKVMHENNIYRRYLKPLVRPLVAVLSHRLNVDRVQSILIVSLDPMEIKICDFSISKQVGDHTAARTMTGILNYIAPKAFGAGISSTSSSPTSTYTSAVDIFPLGCVIFAILTKETPFPDIYELERYTLVSDCLSRNEVVRKWRKLDCN